MLLDLVRPGIDAVKRFWKPLLLIELCGLAVVIAYFQSPEMRSVADVLGQWKESGGLLFAMAACAFASTIVPETAKMIALGDTHWGRLRLNNLVFNIGFFSLMGAVANYFYPFQEWLFPSDGRTVTALKKMAIDQFLYTPLITLPMVSLAFTLREVGWSIPRFLRSLTPTWYARRIGHLIIPCWCFWMPMTLLMYSLPPNLVFVFCMFAQAAWVLVMLFVAEHSGQRAHVAVEPTGPATT